MKSFKILITLFLGLAFASCNEDFLELEPKGIDLEINYYETEDEMFQALVAVYDPLQWGGTNNAWTMKLGLLNAASDDTFAGGSDASDQPSWVAWDNFNLNSELGPQGGLWSKSYSGIYRANIFLEKIEETTVVSDVFRARSIAEVKFLRAYFYFDLVRFFGDVPLIIRTLGADDVYNQAQVPAAQIYAQIEQDLNDAKNAPELPATVSASELGRVTKGAVNALLGKVILYQNDESRMAEAASIFEEVINAGIYDLEPNFEDIFKQENEFGIESVFEINFSDNSRRGWDAFVNGTEGNYNVQFFGMRDYVGPSYASGWSFCPVTPKLVDLMRNDPRYDATIIDGNLLKLQGASYTEGYQNTDFFIRKYAGLETERALDGEPALNWVNNIREIRFADVLLMAAEAHARAGNASAAVPYLNRIRQRVSIQPYPPSLSGENLLNAIYRERQFELATEGHRFFDLVRTGRAATELADQGFVAGTHELLPIPQTEIDITEGLIKQNPGY